ncbi:hypothetical protein M011DRAFT_398566 [Sporormia fimetaria CBS 119925]|uniref:Uncharacterized protein n=1 Tax=Sporormia fimetaria CBS 119925 TaxID=1340428 RepID=A0A6A6VHG6_9PLEO|nr:hypothetical protein M011DRAFT_398566 [Sporormia fimetaria CBS 119925]
MDTALSRKRSRLELDPEDDHSRYRDSSADGPPAELKKTRKQGELDEIDLVPPEEAWMMDLNSLFSSPTFHSSPAVSKQLQPHNNTANYVEGSSIIVLCVQGNLHLHYDLLCAVLSQLYTLAPSLQALVVCPDPTSHLPSTTASVLLPLVQGYGPHYNHFVKLGLLHPAGGGQVPLDALVVLDGKGRRRLVLPFGWGAGRHATSPAGKGVQSSLMGRLRMCVERLSREV